MVCNRCRFLSRMVTVCVIVAMLTVSFQHVPGVRSQEPTPVPPDSGQPPEPPPATSTPIPSPTPTTSPTATDTPTALPTDTPTPLPSATQTVTATASPTITDTPTVLPTDTPIPSPAATLPSTPVPPVSEPTWLLVDGAEVDAGLWTMTSGWTRSETDAAHDGRWLWTTGDQDTISIDETSLSWNTPIVLPSTARITLSYWLRTSVESPDSLHVQVETGTGLWQPVAQDTASGAPDWTLRTIDLSPFAGQSVRLRFVVVPDTNPVTENTIWQVDDIGLLAEPALWQPTPAATAAVSPTLTPLATDTEVPAQGAEPATATPVPTTEPPYTTVADTDARLAYSGGTWQTFQVAGAAGSTLTGTADAGATLTVRFSGIGIRLIYSKGPEGQDFTAQVDGVVQTGDSQAAQYSYGHALTFDNLPDGEHVLTVTNGPGALWIEAIQVQGAVLEPLAVESVVSAQPPVLIPEEAAWTTYADTDAAVNYGCGQWQTFPVRGATGGSLTGSADPYSTMTVTFEGRGIAVIHSAGPEGRTFSVELDGSVTQVADGYAEQYTYGHQVRFAGLSDGEHVLTVTNGEGALWIEAIQVQGQLKTTVQSQPRCPQPTATPVDLPDYTPPSACWVQHWNGQGSTEWAISNPNPVPLSTNPEVKLRYDWAVYKKLNASGQLLQSAQGWDNPNPNPVNTVYAQSLKLNWYLTINGQNTAILGTQIVNADETGRCTPPEPTTTPTFTPTAVPSITPDPDACLMIGVDNTGQSASQFFWLDTDTGRSADLGPRYDGFDIEGIDVHPVTGVLYAVGGHRVQDDGPVYQMDASGTLTLLGTTGYRDQVAASFRPSDSSFWIFVAQVGLVTVDLSDVSQTTVQYTTKKKVEAIAWNEDGSLLYALVGRDLYVYNPASGSFSRTCKNLLPGDVISALEWGPDGLVSGVHHGTETQFVNIDPAACRVTAPLYSAPYHHVKSLTYDLACTAPTPTPTHTPTLTPTDTHTPTDTPTATPTDTPTPTFTPTDTNTPTPTDTPTATPTFTPTFTPTDTPTATPTDTPTFTPTPTSTPTLPSGVMCYDWRWGDAFGWMDSSPDHVTWDDNGMYATSDPGDPLIASAYYALAAGGPWSLALTSNNIGTFTVAQGAAAPAPGELLSQTVSADAAGVYVLSEPFVQLQWAAEGPLTADTTTIFYTFCLGEVPPGTNRPPQVDAGPDLDIFTTGPDPIVVTLNGTATDDGLPDGTLILLWDLTDGPDSLVLADATVEDPTVMLTEPGVYLLRLTADDGELSASDTMQITVHPPIDLTVSAVNISGMAVDPGTLAVSGTVVAELANLGTGATTESFTLTIFEDRNANGIYEPTIDNRLGATEVAELDASATASSAVPVSGEVLFNGNLVYAFVDSQNVVAESDETNNYNRTGGECLPSEPGDFSPILEWKWDSGVVVGGRTYTQVMMAPAVADITGDGMPEVIFVAYKDTTSWETNLGSIDGHLVVARGDGTQLFAITDAAYDLFPGDNLAVGDVDLNGSPEIIAMHESRTKLIAFEYNGSDLVVKWQSSPAIDQPRSTSAVSIANLDGSGPPEIVWDNIIFTSDGTKLWEGSPSGLYDEWGSLLAYIPTIANIDLTGNMEVLTGNKTYAWTGTELQLLWTAAVPDGTFNAVGNFDADPFPEVVLVAQGSVYLLEHTGDVIWGPVQLPDNGIKHGGPPTIADVDNDGEPEIGVAGAEWYVLIETDGSIKWLADSHDASSGRTGSSVFDFEGDGSVEIIYGDDDQLRIFRGIDGAALWSVPNTSGTNIELPVVADVDADGHVEIVKAANVFNKYAPPAIAGIYVYGDSAGNWVPTREIWNQHTYHITNVNADGSIPTIEANNWLIYNNFRQNIYTLACASSRPDLTASYVRRADGTNGITLTARIGNGGGVFVPAGVYVSFYDGDPTAGGALLGTTTTSTRLDPGNYQDVSLVVPFNTSANPVWVVADDQGGLNGLHTELDEVNNLHASLVILMPLAYRTYTLDADFDEGDYQHVNHEAQADELRLQGYPDRFEYLWVAVSSKGTVVKIDINTGAILGEYWTSPSGQPRNPSRTTVDNYGSVWVANRDGNSVTKIGLLENNECEDRNGDGVIQTSTGQNDLLLWTNADGADTNGGVSTAEDECIIQYVRVSASGTRHVSVDRDNNVWVSGTGNNAGVFNLINGETGQILRTEGPVGYGGYGGLIDANGVIWSARNLLRWDTALPLSGANGTNWTGWGHDSYGLCIDSQGNVWNTSYSGNQIRKFAPDGTLLATYAHGYNNAQGCVIDYNDHVWVAQSGGNSIGHLLPDGTLVGRITVGNTPTGAAVDVNGKIWVTNRYSRTVMRIDPALGPIGGGGVPVGAVDFTSPDLGGELYNYSDMTGSTLTKLPDEGHWEVVFDSAIEDAAWGVLGWTENICNDGQIEVFAASSHDGTTFSALTGVDNGGTIAVPDGRYLRITVNFKRATTGETPVLYDLTVGTAGYVLPDLPPAPPMTCIDTRPDLTVSNLQQTVNGSDLTLAARVNNLGGIAAPPGAVVTFYSGNPAQPGTVALGTAATTGEILPGTFETVILTLPLGTTARPVWLVVDEANVIGELNERNNTYASTLYLSPDLLVNGVDLSGMVFDIDTLEARGDIQVDIGNIGTAEAFGGYTVLLFEDRDGDGAYDEAVDQLLGGALPSVLLPGETVSVTFPLAEGTQLSFRDSILAVVVDSDHLQVELDETNNTWTTADPALPDLTASYMREVEYEDRTELTVRIGNGGQVTVPAGAEVAFYDGDPNDGGTLLDTVLTTLDLTPGAYEDMLLSLPLGTTALPVWVWVDPADIYAEPDEVNNLYETRAWVTPVPNAAPEVDAGPDRVLPLPGGSITLHATAMDDGWPIGELRIRWRVVSGPGEVTFDDDTSLTPQLTASKAGEYVLELTADDREYRASDTMTLTAMTAPLCDPDTIQGFIASPLNEAHVLGQAPVTLAADADLTHLRVDLWPEFNPDSFRPLAENVTGTGGATIATLDTTLLANDSYVLCAVGFDTTTENWRSAAVMVTVEGENKPGRVRFSVTDLVVPLTGLPIAIGRTYDSLERDYNGDFGYGWKLDIANPRVEVDAANNVTLTMPDGSRKTFYFTPYAPSWVFGFLSLPKYTPEPGVYGSLESNGCGLLTVSGGQTFCFPGPLYAETVTEFTYTDPYGREFVMSADGALKSIRDLNDNTLTFSPGGITSSAGLSVPFVRDSQGRIVRITDPMGHVYRYEYDAAGDLVAVHLPDTPAISYDYYDTPALAHFFRSGTDPRGNTVATATYYPDGRLETVTDALGNVTSYAYDLYGAQPNQTVTTITHPDGGTVEVTRDDTYGGKVTQERVMISLDPPTYRTTTFAYDESFNLMAETVDAGGLNLTATYTYDDKGNRTSVTNPLGVKVIEADYNQYGGPETITGPAVQVENVPGVLTTEASTIGVSYSSSYMPLNITDNLGYVGGYTWDSHGNPLTQKNGNQHATTFVYDAYGNVIEQRDPLGRTTTSTYDTLGRRTSRTEPCDTNPAGCTTTYEYDALGRLEQVTDPDHVTEYEYDANGNRTAVIQHSAQGDRRTDYEYDAANQLTAVTSPDGVVTRYEYDSMGRQTRVITNYVDGVYDPGMPDEDLIREMTYNVGGELLEERTLSCCGSARTTYAYDSAGRLDWSEDATGVRTDYTYDNAGRLTRETDENGYYFEYTYNDAGWLTAVRDRRGNVTHYYYDVRGRLVRTHYPDGSETTTTYDSAGQRDRVTELNGAITDYDYNAAGQLTFVTSALGTSNQTVTEYRYDPVTGLQNEIIDPLGRRTTFEYDALGRQVQITGNYVDGVFNANVPDEDLIQTFDYDDLGQLTDVTDANGTVTHYVYDTVGRRIETISNYKPGQPATVDQNLSHTVSYDDAGRQIASTDPNGKTTTYAYDDYGRLASVTNPMGQTTSYTYDAAGRLLSITDANGHQTALQYDALGRLYRKYWPDPVTGLADPSTYEQFGYDAAGNLTSHRLADGQTNTFTYDAMNRLDVANYFDGQTLDYAYTAAGQVNTISDARGLVDYDYDWQNRPISVTYGGASISYTYDVAGNRTSMTTPAGTTTYSYDDVNRLAAVTFGSDTTTFAYDPVGLLTQIARPNGVLSTTTYDGAYRPETIVHSRSGQTLDSFAYTYDAAGNRTNVTEFDGTVITWTYDDAYRLTGETRDGISTTYTYDATGNRLTMTQGGATTTYVYNALDQLLCTTTGVDCTTGVLTSYTYDGRGNLVQESDGVTTTSYTFDARDLLTGVTTGSATLAYTYDAGGRRISEDLNGMVTNYRWDEFSPYGDIVVETDGSGAVTASYVLANGSLISQTRGGANSYTLTDAQGSVRALTDASGAVIESYDYAAFGDLLQDIPDPLSSYLYTGQRYDATTAQYYLRAREYDPAVGRFLSRDTWAVEPWNPVELNRYVYAAANPVTWGDPSGHMAETAAINMQVGTVDITALLIYSAALTCIYYFQTITVMQFAGIDTTLIRAAAPAGCEPPKRDDDEEEKCDYRVLRYIDQPTPRPKNCEAHHPMPSVWMDAHYSNYDRYQAWTILMPLADHLATQAVQKSWMVNTYGYRNFPWRQISFEEMKLVANRMLDATNTPAGKRQEYWRKFEMYRLALVSR